MPLPVVSGAEAIRRLARVGFERHTQRGSHVKFRRADGRTVIGPLQRELAPGTLRSILRQAGIAPATFVELER